MHAGQLRLYLRQHSLVDTCLARKRSGTGSGSSLWQIALAAQALLQVLLLEYLRYDPFAQAEFASSRAPEHLTERYISSWQPCLGALHAGHRRGTTLGRAQAQLHILLDARASLCGSLVPQGELSDGGCLCLEHMCICPEGLKYAHSIGRSVLAHDTVRSLAKGEFEARRVANVR